MADSAVVTATELIVVAIAIFLASFVQILAGFGFALLAMPIMTLAIPVEKAVIVSTLLGILTSTWQFAHLRREADMPLVRRLVIGAFVGMPLGIWVLVAVSDRVLRIALGVSVLVATGLLVRRVSLQHLGHGFDYVAGFLSGVLNTSLSTNGPPLVFDLQARALPPERFRATLVGVFAFSNIVGIALFLSAGKVTGEGLTAAAAALPAWAIGQVSAWPLRRHLHGERFRRLVLGLLFLAGLSAIVAAVR